MINEYLTIFVIQAVVVSFTEWNHRSVAPLSIFKITTDYIGTCTYNYQTTLITTAFIQMKTQLSNARRHDELNTDVNTTTIQSLSRRPLCICKHSYHTPSVTTTSIQMYIQLSSSRHHDDLYTVVRIRPPSRRHFCRCKHNYHTPSVTTASMQM